MKLLMVNQSRDRVDKAWLERWVRALSRLITKKKLGKLSRRELVVVFVTSGEIRRLNKLYRRKDYSTDILSFVGPDESTVGELVLCMPVIRAQSKRTGLSVKGELGYMIVHGVLHLLGYDHMKKSEEAEMFALQDSLFAELVKPRRRG